MKSRSCVVFALCYFPLVSFAGGLIPDERPVSLFQILTDKAVIEEIEVIDEQMDEIALLRREFKKLMNEYLRQAFKSSNSSRAERAKAIQEVIFKSPEVEERLLRQVLIEDQVKRLKEIWRQKEIEKKGVVHVLERTLGEDIQLDAKQLQEIRELEKAAELERNKVLQELRQKKYQAMLEVLNREQKKQWTKLLGDPLAVK